MSIVSPAAAEIPAAGRPIRLRRMGDELLARYATRGSQRAFAALYERYHQPLYRYCRSIVRNEADAQDALQSTFASALSALRRDARNAPLRPWLYRIAHNESVSLVRRRKRDTPHETPVESTVPGSSAEEEAAGRARWQRLVDDLAGLPERQRGALLLRELAGLSHEEIALALGLTLGTAKQAIFEARQGLAEAEEGRMMSCEEVRRRVSEGDRRVLRGRRVRAHLGDCAACEAFASAIPARRSDLCALAPGLPAATAASMLGGLIGGGSSHGGGAAAAGSAASAGPAAGAGSAATAGAVGKAAGTVAALKTMAGAALVVTAAAGVTGLTTHVLHHRGSDPRPRSEARLHHAGGVTGGGLAHASAVHRSVVSRAGAKRARVAYAARATPGHPVRGHGSGAAGAWALHVGSRAKAGHRDHGAHGSLGIGQRGRQHRDGSGAGGSRSGGSRSGGNQAGGRGDHHTGATRSGGGSYGGGGRSNHYASSPGSAAGHSSAVVHTRPRGGSGPLDMQGVSQNQMGGGGLTSAGPLTQGGGLTNGASQSPGGQGAHSLHST